MEVSQDAISEVMRTLGHRGGLARAKALTPKQRRDSALKASRAAAKARTRKAQQKKAPQ